MVCFSASSRLFIEISLKSNKLCHLTALEMCRDGKVMWLICLEFPIVLHTRIWSGISYQKINCSVSPQKFYSTALSQLTNSEQFAQKNTLDIANFWLNDVIRERVLNKISIYGSVGVFLQCHSYQCLS